MPSPVVERLEATKSDGWGVGFGNDDTSQINYQGPELEKLLQEDRGFGIERLIFWRPAFSCHFTIYVSGVRWGNISVMECKHT